MIWRYLIFLAALGATVASASLVGGRDKTALQDFVIVRVP